MTMVPAQTLDTAVWDARVEDARDLHLKAAERRWWYLEPGEFGYDQPLHEYLGMTEQQWREYAISERRAR